MTENLENFHGFDVTIDTIDENGNIEIAIIKVRLPIMSVSGSRTETDIICQFLHPETDI